MQQERKVIGQGSIIVFDRDVNSSEINKLTKEFCGDIVILEDLIVDKDLHIKSNLHIIGDIVCCADKDIYIDGDLECYREIGGYNIYVNGCFYCEGTISADNIIVSESFCCKNRIEAYGGKITVLGDFECHGIKAKSVETYGETYMGGSISVRNFIKSGY